MPTQGMLALAWGLTNPGRPLRSGRSMAPGATGSALALRRVAGAGHSASVPASATYRARTDDQYLHSFAEGKKIGYLRVEG